MLNFARITAAAVFALAPGLAAAEVVAAPDLQDACRNEAAARLGRSFDKLLLLPVEWSNNTYIVGGSVDEGPNSGAFECIFDPYKKLVAFENYGVAPAGGGSTTGASGDGPSEAAFTACLNRVGGPAGIDMVSSLRPGYFEIIVRNTRTGARFACTVNPSAGIEDWVAMR